MLDDTLVIWSGEFGRTPDNGMRGGSHVAGRDHNAKAMIMWMAGGGVRAGHEVGATDELGAEAVEVVRPIRDVHTTILHMLGLNDNNLTYFHEGRFKQLSQTGGGAFLTGGLWTGPRKAWGSMDTKSPEKARPRSRLSRIIWPASPAPAEAGWKRCTATR